MGQFSTIDIDSAHITTEGPGLQTRLTWVKPGLWAKPSHSLYLEYMWQVSKDLYQTYN